MYDLILIHTSGLEHGLELLLAGWIYLILISVFNFLSFSMISYHCSVILSLFIISYLFCNYLSRFVFISLYLWLSARRICVHICLYFCYYLLYGAARSRDRTTFCIPLLFIMLLLILRHCDGSIRRTLECDRHWIFCLIKLYFIWLNFMEFMELIVSASFQQCRFSKHSLSSLGSAPVSSC